MRCVNHQPETCGDSTAVQARYGCVQSSRRKGGVQPLYMHNTGPPGAGTRVWPGAQRPHDQLVRILGAVLSNQHHREAESVALPVVLHSKSLVPRNAAVQAAAVTGTGYRPKGADSALAAELLPRTSGSDL